MLSYYFNFKIKCSFFNVKFDFLMNVLCILFLKRINFFSYHFVINVFKKGFRITNILGTHLCIFNTNLY